MLGYSVSSQLGRIQTGEMDLVFEPRIPRFSHGIIACHGAGNPHEFLDTTNQSASVILAAYLAQYGFYVVAGDFGGDTWGNDTVVTRINTALTLLGTYGCATDKAGLLGASMGAASAIRWAQANPTKVTALVGLIPVVDPNDIYQNNRGGYQSSIGTAWGITFPTALPARGQLSSSTNEALFTGPQQLYYSTADTIVIPSAVTSYAAATGASKTVTDTTAGHSNAAIAGANPMLIAQFFAANS